MKCIMKDICPICYSLNRTSLIRADHIEKFLYGKFVPTSLQKSICLDCGHIYSSRYYDKSFVTNHYENTRNSAGKLIYNSEEKLNKTFLNLAEWSTKTIKADSPNYDIKTILDIGCGKCDFLAGLRNVYPNALLYGNDISAQSALIGKAKGLENVIIGEFSENLFPEYEFDFISATGVLEHQFDIGRFLESIVNLLHKGSYFLVEVPDSYAIMNSRDDLGAKYMHDLLNDEHVHHFTQENLFRLMNRYGFRLVDQRTMSRGIWEVMDVLFKYEGGRFANAISQSGGNKLNATFKEAFYGKKNIYLKKFQDILQKHRSIGIYGAGWHTSFVLLVFFEMNFDRVKRIFDQDNRKIGNRLYNVDISFPDRKGLETVQTILVSSISMEDSIVNYLLRLGIPQEKILPLYKILDEQ